MNIDTLHSQKRPMRYLYFLGSLLFVLISFTGNVCLANVSPVKFNTNRNKIIAHILSYQLPYQHFSHEALDDQLSKAAFDLYIKQLDPRKRFLLQSDIDQLKAFADLIDDELKQGNMILPDAGAQMLNKRIHQVESFIDELIEAGFDFDKEEFLEIDPEKLEHPADLAALKNRWRKILKLQILDNYYDDLDAEKKAEEEQEKTEKLPTFAERIEEEKGKVKKRAHRALERLLKETRQDHYDRFYDCITRAYDPHTNYMSPISNEDFNIHMSGSLEGIGAILNEDDGLIKVVRLLPGGPAEKQGQLQGEDTILAVAEKNGESVEITDMRIREAVSYIRGPKGTEVRLTVQHPDGAKQVIPIIRDIVQLEESYVKSTPLKTNEGKTYGYLRIPSFYRDFEADNMGKNATNDTRAELEKLKKQNVEGIVLDLRNNGGGALDDAVYISGLFLPGGPVVQIKDSTGAIKVREDKDRDVVYDGPLIVLVNQFSASASEILAAALQDYGRALIIGGKHTHGKGTVQAKMDINRKIQPIQLLKYGELGALKLTIQKFYRINGDSTQFKGVTPDIIVPSMLDYLESGEKYMDNPLPWDQVKDIGYSKWEGPSFDVQLLKKDAQDWISHNEKFQLIKEEVAKAEARKKNSQMALSLSSSQKERKEIEEARKRAQEVGVLNPDKEEEEDSESSLSAAKIKKDPFVQVSLFLLEDREASGPAITKAN